MKPRYFGTGVAVVGMAGIAWLMWPAPLAVETAKLARGSVVSVIESEGKTQVRTRFIVSARVDGELERIELQPGDRVARASIVARIRPIASRPLDRRSRAEATAAVRVAQAAVARADAAQQEAAVAFEHADRLRTEAEQLAQQSAAPASRATHASHEATIRRRALEEASAASAQARAELARATAILSPPDAEGETVPIVSPEDGQVLRVLREDAGPVAAGTPLIEIGDLTRLQVVADLLSEDATLVREGMEARISASSARDALEARVQRIDPAAFAKVSALGLQEQRVHVTLAFQGEVPAGIGHDFRVDVSIVAWKGADVLRVPSTALFRSGEQWTVLVVRDGRVRLQPVQTAASDVEWTAVDRGVREGDVVIVQPSDEIREGTRVRSLDRASASSAAGLVVPTQ